ncbi:hypothetical protein FRC15_002220 [Serendipita sp. 397]|nr:hypothetical protein FRC15_002220 [Serendipita sp. 397]
MSPLYSDPSYWLLGSTVALVLLVISSYRSYRKSLQLVYGTPGIRSLISLIQPAIFVIPAGKIPFTNFWGTPGPSYWARRKYEAFNDAEQDIISAVSADFSSPMYFIADADVAQEIMANRHRFVKPVELYDVLNLFGHNVLGTEGEQWRVHRKIAAPSFTEGNNRLVYEETVVALDGLFEIWGSGETVDINNFAEVTFAFALMIICSAGFGMRVPWIDTEPPPGHNMTFKRAMEVISSDILLKVIVPRMFMNWSKRTAIVESGFNELQQYIREMIRDRASSYRDYSDLFSNLISANDNDSEGLSLLDEELMGNIFIFLIAGHETTAHSLAFVMGLLALYPDIQEKLYQHIRKNVADPYGTPTYNEIPALNYCLAVFYEGLRMFPSVNRKGEPVVIIIPKGISVNLAVPALHYNPRYWPNPDKFEPERFLGDWPKAAFIPFSGGPRICLGKRFAEIEAIVALAKIVGRYKITVKEEPQYANETFEQRRARILHLRCFITSTPTRIPVTLTRRK